MKVRMVVAVGLVVVTGLVVTGFTIGTTAGDYPGTTDIRFPDCPAVTRTATGRHYSSFYFANNTSTPNGTWDLSKASWYGTPDGSYEYPIRSESWAYACQLGGKVFGNLPEGINTNATRDCWYGSTPASDATCSYPSGEAFRQTLTDDPNNWLYIKDAYAYDVEDAYDPNSDVTTNTTYLNHVKAEHIRDDCIENEGSGTQVPMNLFMNNSFFDGCFSAFAERPEGSKTRRNGTYHSTFEVTNSLVRIEPQPVGPAYCDAIRVSHDRCLTTSDPKVWLASYGIWKWSNEASATVILKNVIFRLDTASYSSCQSQKWPKGTYENVTVVWTGTAPYASAGDCHNRLPSGVRLTTDVNVWNKAVAEWEAQ